MNIRMCPSYPLDRPIEPTIDIYTNVRVSCTNIGGGYNRMEAPRRQPRRQLHVLHRVTSSLGRRFGLRRQVVTNERASLV